MDRVWMRRRTGRSGKRQGSASAWKKQGRMRKKNKIGFCLFILCPFLFVVARFDWERKDEKKTREREEEGVTVEHGRIGLKFKLVGVLLYSV